VESVLIAAERAVAAGGSVRTEDLELQTFIIYHAVESVIERTLIYRPELLETDAFWDQLMELAWRFLRADE